MLSDVTGSGKNVAPVQEINTATNLMNVSISGEATGKQLGVAANALGQLAGTLYDCAASEFGSLQESMQDFANRLSNTASALVNMANQAVSTFDSVAHCFHAFGNLFQLMMGEKPSPFPALTSGGMSVSPADIEPDALAAAGEALQALNVSEASGGTLQAVFSGALQSVGSVQSGFVDVVKPLINSAPNVYYAVTLPGGDIIAREEPIARETGLPNYPRSKY